MIRVILQARTGNNFFQYAAARSLALHHKCELILDASWCERQWLRQMQEILKLPIQAKFHTQFQNVHRVIRKFANIQPWNMHRGHVFIEPSYDFYRQFYSLPSDTVLIGYFQSPLYFKKFESMIRSELCLDCIDLPDESKFFEEKITSKPTVSIHVRRGDYLQINNTKCIDADYYLRAISYLNERIENLNFCIFSDDINWCKSQFVGQQFFFCDLNGSHFSPLHDLRLMSSCHHHIIVNSSYSWWGAWLKFAPGNFTIAPKMWMKNIPADDIADENWILL